MFLFGVVPKKTVGKHRYSMCQRSMCSRKSTVSYLRAFLYIPLHVLPSPWVMGLFGLRKDHWTLWTPQGPRHSPHSDHEDQPQCTKAKQQCVLILCKTFFFFVVVVDLWNTHLNIQDWVDNAEVSLSHRRKFHSPLSSVGRASSAHRPLRTYTPLGTHTAVCGSSLGPPDTSNL